MPSGRESGGFFRQTVQKRLVEVWRRVAGVRVEEVFTDTKQDRVGRIATAVSRVGDTIRARRGVVGGFNDGSHSFLRDFGVDALQGPSIFREPLCQGSMVDRAASKDTFPEVSKV